MSCLNKVSIAALAGGLAVMLGMSAVQAQNFQDTQGYWGEPYVETLSQQGVIGGFPDGTFRPNNFITRAQFAAIAAKALNLPTSGGGDQFVDVSRGYWASRAIQAVSSSGLVTGFPDGTFRPEDRITRAQALVILAKALPQSATDAQALAAYRDSRAVPEWAMASVTKAASARIIVNFPNSDEIEPNSLATRGEVAALMYQTLDKLGNRLPPVTIGLVGASTGQDNRNDRFNRKDQITLNRVAVQNRGSLGAGDELVVQAEGTPRAQGTFTIEGIARDLRLEEIQNGLYEGRYTIRRTDKATNARVSVTLERSGERSVTRDADRRVSFAADVGRPRLAEGSLVRGSTPTIYVIQDGRRRGIPNIETFQAQGYRLDQVLVLPDDQLNDLPLGAPLADARSSDPAILAPQLTNLQDNDTVDLPVVLEGRTAPNARVRIRVDASSNILGALGISQQLLNRELVADRNGSFSVTLQPSAILPRGARLRVLLQATDPQSKQSQTTELSLTQR
ncbi:S-layer homology domain-containing protein [Anthocerotibacter panamensis]|uniref:S-layer homology domain-containing protein n=1 Tax=Anthocerotibacter panamensis TaxID=2857077 RepID=UPI001C40264A|nr:S-layer homology domain-containing protein [Anthocerotibacter panamensis]